MPLGDSFQITATELEDIFSRLRPYFPENLTKIEPRPGGYGLRFTFTPFTGREEEPHQPFTHNDPQLGYISESENEAEHLLREKARVVLADLYRAARQEWQEAAYIADLKAVIRDAPARWKTYQHELKALGSAYDYLRTPEAAREWPSAVSRLIDAQDRTKAAAVAFDQRAREIAQVHDTHIYAELGQDAALKAAGYPEAKDWPIADARDYDRDHFNAWDSVLPLAEQARRLIEQQEAHVAKVARLSGTATD
ncbi:hypothetical protein [Streptomyces sp. CB03238]|uniref:hypothetical protein n=1 Tax=Streptomyces sp. CB03238 TaxID=1907777 RepID=UPI000A113304|nr:hypothetical protein [Streptomyces sp. CB03238]ORT53475.1 hypothetical protein BKD26_38230 [Streptomyces sp. CB03238]